VTITGTGFTEVSAVRFGSAPAKSFKVNSETSITAVSPAGSGTIDVTVTTSGGGSSGASPADRFTYVTLPELGRCVKSAPEMGEYKFGHCAVPAAGKGSNNWLMGPGEKRKFTSVLKAPAIETTGGNKVLITCASGTAEGEYTGSHTLTVKKLVFSGCAESPAKGLASDCQNTGGANGQIEAKELAGELGFVAHTAKPKVGVDLKAASGSVMAAFECGGASEVTGKGTGTGTPRELEGSVIGNVKAINTMALKNALSYEASGGHQAPEHFEGGVRDTLTTLVGLQKTAEPTTLVALEEVKNEEPLEINTVV
jgi:hypothetical protein